MKIKYNIFFLNIQAMKSFGTNKTKINDDMFYSLVDIHTSNVDVTLN
jgi:hypothetical protein